MLFDPAWKLQTGNTKAMTLLSQIIFISRKGAKAQRTGKFLFEFRKQRPITDMQKQGFSEVRVHLQALPELTPAEDRRSAILFFYFAPLPLRDIILSFLSMFGTAMSR
jgi:hypothetical protein